MPKNSSAWTNNDVKKSTPWVSATKKPAQFKPEIAPGLPYPYDSPLIPYDSNLWFYDTIVNNNQINQLVTTQWAESQL